MPGVDSGAINSELGIQECDIVLQIGEKVKCYLEQAGLEVQALQSDNLSGESPDYPNVTATANEWGADIFIALHCNAANKNARGTETLVYDLDSDSSKLATCVQNQLINTLKTIDRGVKENQHLAVLKYTDMPAILVEIAFIDQNNDAVLLINNQDDIARAIARGITDYEQ